VQNRDCEPEGPVLGGPGRRLAWLMSCWWPVMRASGFLPSSGSHRNIVKSSEPDTSRSPRAPLSSSYLKPSPDASVSTQSWLASATPRRSPSLFLDAPFLCERLGLLGVLRRRLARVVERARAESVLRAQPQRVHPVPVSLQLPHQLALRRLPHVDGGVLRAPPQCVSS
jgi:hypothetical protein